MAEISLITPNYNGERWLNECLDSVANQTISQDRVEMILVDDGSTDMSREIITQYRKDIPGLKTIWHEHTGQPGELRNFALRQAIGKYALFLDSDDYLGVESLERLSEFANSHAPDVLAFQLAGLNRRVPSSMLSETIEDANVVDSGLYKTLGTWKMCRHDYLIDNNIRFGSLPRGEDTLFFAEAMLRARKLSVVSGYPFYTVRGREDGTSITQTEWDNGERITIAKHMAGLVMRLAQNEDVANHFLIRVFNTDAIGVLSSEHSASDRADLYSALKPFWNNQVKELIYTEANRSVLSNFFGEEHD